MIKIHYEDKIDNKGNHKYLTPCPFNYQHSRYLDEGEVMVGNKVCRKVCPYNKGTDTTEKVVICTGAE